MIDHTYGKMENRRTSGPFTGQNFGHDGTRGTVFTWNVPERTEVDLIYRIGQEPSDDLVNLLEHLIGAM
jgi:hypothetical protein